MGRPRILSDEERRENDLESKRRYNKKYYLRNIENEIVRNKQYREENKERIKECAREYRSKNCEKIREQKRRHYFENKDIYNARARKNRVRKNEATRRWRDTHRVRILEKRKTYYYSNLRMLREKSMLRGRKNTIDISDSYIAKMLCMPVKDIPDELMEAKRAQIKALRTARELSRALIERGGKNERATRSIESDS